MITGMGKMIRKLMVDTDLAQNKLAEEIGLSPSTFSNYLTGKNVPDMEIIQRLIERFHLEGTDLKTIFSSHFTSTAESNQKISIDTRFLSQERVEMLVQLITVLLLYPQEPTVAQYDPERYLLPRIKNLKKEIDSFYNSLDDLKGLDYTPPASPQAIPSAER